MPKSILSRFKNEDLRLKIRKSIFLNPKSGFTLIELMVAIAIVAVLATIGITVFTGLQKNGRDTRRAGDINSISKAFETHYLALAGTCDGQSATDQPTYCPLQANWFASGIVPVDPLGSKNLYCIQTNDTSTVIADPAAGTALWNACPTGWDPIAVNTPDWTAGVAPFTAWKVCARKEGQAQVICQGSSQL